MKKILSVFLCIMLFSLVANAQLSNNPLFKNVDLTKIKPSEIPDESSLRKLGATEEEIKMLMEMKKKGNTTLEEGVEKNRSDENEREKNAPQQPAKVAPVVKTVVDSLPKVSFFGQEFFRNKSLASFDKSGTSRAPDNYILSSRDQIAISVWGYSDYNENFTIDNEGYIQPIQAGRIYLKGLQFGDAKELIKKKFGSFLDLRNSKIDITVSAPRTVSVNIVGEVMSPGTYSISAFHTVFNALIIANGPNAMGSVRSITVKRGGKVAKVLDVYNFLLNPSSNEEFFLEDNDYIIIETAVKVVGIIGEVRRPGSFELKANEGIIDLIKYAGGFKSTGFTGSLDVKRQKNQINYVEDVNYDSLIAQKKDFILLDGDTVNVKPVPVAPEGYVDIEGSVRVPGRYKYIKKELISDLMKRAKGITDNTYLGRGYLVRLKPDHSKEYFSFDVADISANSTHPDNKELIPYDRVLLYSKYKFLDPDSFYIGGAVRNPGRLLYGENVTVKDAIFMAGGFQKDAANNKVEVYRLSNYGKGSTDTSRVVALNAKINFDLSIDNDAADFKLQPNDIVMVRSLAFFEYQQNVVIAGEVLYPGSYSLLDKNEKLFDLIARAGGFTPWADPSASSLFRTEDKLGFLFMNFNLDEYNKGKSESNYVLKGGDKINIPKINNLVSIKGAIEYPGIDTILRINSPFFKGKRAGYYIRNFGAGYAKGASKKRTYVIQPGGFIDKSSNWLLFTSKPKVKLGATVVAVYKPNKDKKDKKRSEPVDWNKTIENLTVKLAGVLTLWLLLTQINKTN